MFKKLGMISLILVMLPLGCSTMKKSSLFAHRDTAYLSATSMPPLKLPPDMSATSFKNDYPIKNDNVANHPIKVSEIPPGLY